MKFEATIKIWSRIGYCPITERQGKFCDLLLDKKIMVENRTNARIETQKAIKETKHGETGAYQYYDKIFKKYESNFHKENL